VGCLIGTYERADSIRTDAPETVAEMGMLDPA
jgi:hypothetical protein